MGPSWRLLAGLTLLAGTTPLLTPAVPDEKELAANRRLFEEYRKDPAHYDRLKRDWRAFRALPKDQQDRIRRLDQELRQEDSATQAKLWRALERYAAWLERLPEDERRRVESAAGAEERLPIIQDLREGEWLARQPRAVRELVQKAPADRRAQLVREEQRKERLRRQEWQRALKQPQYKRLAQFPPDVQTFVNESLRPLLTDKERLDLKNAEGKWWFGSTVVELADRHPIKLPPSPTIGPRNPAELRERGRGIQVKTLDPARLKEVQNKWPDFALYINEVARSRSLKLPPLGPCRPEEFTKAVQDFIACELTPKLNDEEKDRLEKAKGQWPEYPHAVMELAKKYQLPVPGLALPGSGEFWDNLRAELPDVPDRVLREFALTRLTPEERQQLQLSSSDPLSKERLKRKLFERDPEALQRLRTFDMQAAPRKEKGGF